MQLNRISTRRPVPGHPWAIGSRLPRALGIVMSIGVVLAGVSCRSTSTQSYPSSLVQKTGPFRSAAVVAVDDRAEIRAFVEDLFVKRLEERGVRAEASHGLFPLSDLKDHREEVRRKLAGTRAEAVLLARVAGQADMITRSAVGVGMWDSALEWMRPYGQPVELYGGGDLRTTVRLESNLYRLQDSALVWVAHTDTVLKEDTDRAARIRDITRTLVERMARDGVIP